MRPQMHNIRAVGFWRHCGDTEFADKTTQFAEGKYDISVVKG